MNEADTEILRLLTELRDLQREELAYRRRLLDESMADQKQSLEIQRTAIRLQQVANGRQKQAIVAQRVAIAMLLLLIVVLATIGYALIAR